MTSKVTGPPPENGAKETPAQQRRYDTFDPDPKAMANKRKKRLRETLLEQKAKRVARARRIALLLLALAVVGAIAITPIVFPGAHVLKEMPPSLIGVWITDDELYESRQISIRPKSIQFTGAGPGDQRYIIEKVTKEETEAELLYTVFTGDADGDDYQFALVYETGERASFQFQTRPGVVWRRLR